MDKETDEVGIFTITYELNTIFHNYSKLFEAIMNLGDYQHPLSTMWIIKSEYDVNSIQKHLTQFLIKGDKLFVADITNSDRQGWISKKVWAWLKKSEVGL